MIQLHTFIYICLCIVLTASQDAQFNVGIGKSDVTGPAGSAGMMGYARWEQLTAGIINRLFARSFVIEDSTSKDRILFIHCDIHSIPQSLHQELIQQLGEIYGKDVYNEHNVLIHGQHTHSGPGGLHTYYMYYLSTWGFNQRYFNYVVHQVLKSVDLAHNSIEPANILFSTGELEQCGKQRSLEAYLMNPKEERDQYKYDRNTLMTNIEIRRQDNTLRGVLNIFAVHSTSLPNFNTMISSDNKGYAEWLLERKYPGTTFAFAQGDSGDVSPNLVDNGDGTFMGEGDTYVKSAEIIGKRQADLADTLIHDPKTKKTKLSGTINGYLRYADFSNITLDSGRRTCPALIGQNFLTGTEDGRGVPFIYEGNLRHATLPSVIGKVMFGTVSEEVAKCHAPKHPGLGSGETVPIPSSPEVLPSQIIRIGSLAIIGVPFEVTTMAGRRIRKAVQQNLTKHGINHVELVTMANAYAGYVTTEEEYNAQHYEGASTHFGPLQLDAIIQELGYVAKQLVDKTPNLVQSIKPREFKNREEITSLYFDRMVDIAPNLEQKFGGAFSDIKSDTTVRAGRDIVTIGFWGGHPQNKYELVESFCTVEQLDRVSGKYIPYLKDDDWNVRFMWKQRLYFVSQTFCEWAIDGAVPTGSYRIVYNGYAKAFMGKYSKIQGTSSNFNVKNDLTGIENTRYQIYPQHDTVSHYHGNTIENVITFGMVLIVIVYIVSSCRKH